MGDFLLVLTQWADEQATVTVGRYPTSALADVADHRLRRTLPDVVHSVIIDVAVHGGE